ncbi:2EXR family [Microdochium nivale]|nr:2EXR family [Microdochium nivale]
MAAPRDQPPLLLQLPIELRLKIYDICMRDFLGAASARAEAHPESIISPDSAWPLHTLERAEFTPPVRWTCRQIRDETSHLAYHYLHFSVRHWERGGSSSLYTTRRLNSHASCPRDEPLAPRHLYLEWRLPSRPLATRQGQFLKVVKEAFAWHQQRRAGGDNNSSGGTSNTELLLRNLQSIRFILVQAAEIKNVDWGTTEAATMEMLYGNVEVDFNLILDICRPYGQLKSIELQGLFRKGWIDMLEETFEGSAQLFRGEPCPAPWSGSEPGDEVGWEMCA